MKGWGMSITFLTGNNFTPATELDGIPGRFAHNLCGMRYKLIPTIQLHLTGSQGWGNQQAVLEAKEAC